MLIKSHLKETEKTNFKYLQKIFFANIFAKNIKLETHMELLHTCTRNNSKLNNTFLNLLIHLIKLYIKEKARA